MSAQAQMGRFVIYRTKDPDNDTWEPLWPHEVPDSVRDMNVMGMLESGHIAKPQGDYWYRGENLDRPLVKAGEVVTCPRQDCGEEVMTAKRDLYRTEYIHLPDHGRCPRCMTKYYRGGWQSNMRLHIKGEGWV